MPLQQALRDPDRAFRNWWNGKDGVPAPRFGKSNNRQSIRLQLNAFGVERENLRLSGVGSIPLAWSRPLPAGPNGVTIGKDCAGRYVASFVVAVERPQLEPNSIAVDLDLGLASLVVTRDGVKSAPPTFLRAAFERF